MHNFIDLVGFEYKKLFKRKSTLISLITLLVIMIMLSIVSITNNSYWHYEGDITRIEAMKLDREAARREAGIIDEDFIKEAIEQNAIMIGNDDNFLINEYGRFLKNEAYIKYVLPYEKAVRIINIIYEVNYDSLSTDGFQFFNLNDIKPIDSLKVTDAQGFYEKINQVILERINSINSLSDMEKERHAKMLSQIDKPFINDYDEGYVFYAQFLEVIALTLLVMAAVCVSPIFANEYQLKTDQLLLTSKYGKNMVIYVKLFTGVSFVFVSAIITLFGSLLSILAILGFSGYDMSIQTFNIFSIYPLTMLQAVMISIGVTIIIVLFFTMLIMLFSSQFKTPFFVVIVSFLIIFLPGLFYISPDNNRLAYQLLQLFPAKATQFFSIFSAYLYEIMGVVLTPAVFYSVFFSIGSLIIIPFIYYSFKNHQIG